MRKLTKLKVFASQVRQKERLIFIYTLHSIKCKLPGGPEMFLLRATCYLMMLDKL